MTQFKYIKPQKTIPHQNTSIYRLKAPGVSEAVLLQTAQGVGLVGDAKIGKISKDINKMIYTEGSKVLQIDKRSGGLQYFDDLLWQKDDGISTFNLLDKKAENIARKFIDDSKLLPPDEYRLARVTHLNVGKIDRSSGKAEERRIDAGVIFQRFIDGLPVMGPGGSAVVYIDPDGSITGCKKVWREIDRVHREVPSTQLRPINIAQKDLENYWKPYNLGSIDVEDMIFGYFEGGMSESQRYMQPAYILPLKLRSLRKGEDGIRSVHVVPASSKPVGNIMPPHTIITPAPKRQA